MPTATSTARIEPHRPQELDAHLDATGRRLPDGPEPLLLDRPGLQPTKPLASSMPPRHPASPCATALPGAPPAAGAGRPPGPVISMPPQELAAHLDAPLADDPEPILLDRSGCPLPA